MKQYFCANLLGFLQKVIQANWCTNGFSDCRRNSDLVQQICHLSISQNRFMIGITVYIFFNLCWLNIVHIWRMWLETQTNSIKRNHDYNVFPQGMFRHMGILIFCSSPTQAIIVESDSTLTGKGRRAQGAHFRVHKVDSGGFRMFESVGNPGKYLRLKDGHLDILVCLWMCLSKNSCLAWTE